MKPSRTSRQKIRRERNERAFRFCGGFLKRLRDESGMTRGDVAIRLKKSPSYIARLEAGQRRIGVVEFMDYMDVVGKNPSQALSELITEIPEAFGELAKENRKSEASR